MAVIFLALSVALALSLAVGYRMWREIRRCHTAIRHLCIDMAHWGQDEDGIPEYAWHDYRIGVDIVGMSALPPLAWPISSEGDPRKDYGKV